MVLSSGLTVVDGLVVDAVGGLVSTRDLPSGLVTDYVSFCSPADHVVFLDEIEPAFDPKVFPKRT